MSSFEECLKEVDEAEVIAVSVRSHTGGRYWDELFMSTRPELPKVDDHGPYRLLEDFEDELPDHVKEMEDEFDQVQSPEFKALVQQWARARLDNVKGYLGKVWNGHETIEIARTMVVSEEWLRELGDVSGETLPASRFGYFWSAEDGAPDSYSSDVNSKGVTITVTAEVAPEAVDFRMTLIARMDYMNADEEGEIRLRMDAEVLVKEVEIDYQMGELEMNSDVPSPAPGGM